MRMTKIKRIWRRMGMGMMNEITMEPGTSTVLTGEVSERCGSRGMMDGQVRGIAARA
jgi:hypothetical protein